MSKARECRCHDGRSRRIRLAIGDVLGNRAVKQKGFLQHQTDVLTIICDRVTPDVGSIHHDGPIGDIIETTDQIHQRALA